MALGKYRKTMLVLVALFTLALLGWLIMDFHNYSALDTVVTDFISYWASGRLLVAGDNPYSSNQIFALQKKVGWTGEDPLVMYSPPWALTFILPFSIQNYIVAKFLWLFCLLTILFISSGWLWRIYGGTDQGRVWSLFVLCSFSPVLFMIAKGQMVPVLILGVAGFLYFEKRQRDYLAGFCTAMIAIKPHIAYLFWIVLLLWAIDQRRWALIKGGLLGGLSISLIPLIYTPGIFISYLNAVVIGQSPHISWATPTLGRFLRLFFGLKVNWLQTVPSVLGTLYILYYWHKKKETWRWDKEMPKILFLSLLTTFYVWVSDYAILVIAMIQSATLILRNQKPRVSKIFITTYLLINGFGWAMYLTLENGQWAIWMVPSLYFSYAMLVRHLDKDTTSSNGELKEGPSLNLQSHGNESVVKQMIGRL